MDKRVKEMVDKCIPCQSVGHGNNPEPMKITPTEDKPWTSVALDFYSPVPQTGQYLLVLIDTYSKFSENLEDKKEENKEYYDRNKRTKEAGIEKGDIVICKQKTNNMLTSKFDPEHYTVEQRKHNTIIAERDGKTVTRNVSHFKKVVMEESEEEQEDTAPGRSTETEEPPKQEPNVRRSARMKRPVIRYQYQT
ncbi:Hypothetical predicted protein [Paramuricea clavata]|uniref:Uncharacterized protein n=1 Tax=Paramuricea clavata TaxID=317549 RepID=A0A7D9EWW3_PARCT|nr:Hypothetical predicted protein [Paramuricea clavata]